MGRRRVQAPEPARSRRRLATVPRQSGLQAPGIQEPERQDLGRPGRRGTDDRAGHLRPDQYHYACEEDRREQGFPRPWKAGSLRSILTGTLKPVKLSRVTRPPTLL